MPLKGRKQTLFWTCLAALVIGAHIAMLNSDTMPRDVAWRLLTVNASIWAVILIPALFLSWRVRRTRGDK
ncbi:hypothetical protein FHS89_001017 [Rubricella aquisinus]|uniref:Uncharacterized protein n=1 Tax=Rubricella aquisinus TaxID=2028108 RepID=A0A840X2W0_9RHOB|nr:phenylalanyl-tRNA synthetase subunit beta [Rubricella aquisinus]MBB5515007.1 hypothetical protein [Rubricella aquisinus]